MVNVMCLLLLNLKTLPDSALPGGSTVFMHGQHKGMPYYKVLKKFPDYARWGRGIRQPSAALQQYLIWFDTYFVDHDNKHGPGVRLRDKPASSSGAGSSTPAKRDKCAVCTDFSGKRLKCTLHRAHLQGVRYPHSDGEAQEDA